MQWGYAASNPEKAYMADCPTLLQLDALYGGGTSAYWVDTQVSAMFGSSSSREKGVVDGIGIFCQSFSSQISGFKMSEVMLFFARYKAGRYDNSYGAFDSRRIGNAFFKEFVPERNKELEFNQPQQACRRNRAQEFHTACRSYELVMAARTPEACLHGRQGSHKTTHSAMRLTIYWSTKDESIRSRIRKRFCIPCGMTVNKETKAT